jgi:hypothetical protein
MNGRVASHEGNKKVGKLLSSDFGALANQQFFTVRRENNFSHEASQAAIPRLILAPQTLLKAGWMTLTYAGSEFFCIFPAAIPCSGA